MSLSVSSYASPRIARELANDNEFRAGASQVKKVEMRFTKDVSKFIRKVDFARKKTAQYSLKFD